MSELFLPQLEFGILVNECNANTEVYIKKTAPTVEVLGVCKHHRHNQGNFSNISHTLAGHAESLNLLLVQLEFFFLPEWTQANLCSVFITLNICPPPLPWPATIYTATEERRIYVGFLLQPSTELRSLSLHFIRSCLMRWLSLPKEQMMKYPMPRCMN